MVVDAVGWRAAMPLLALGPLAGTVAMAGLGRAPSSSRPHTRQREVTAP